MAVFGAYSRYYNLLYRDKDYVGEANYIHRLIQRFLPDAQQVLNLGCGTGSHDFILAEHGYEITGVDISEEMLSVASSRAAGNPPRGGAVEFLHGDIREVRLDKNFDVVLSLFHVISYQTRNEDLSAAFETVKQHLKPGGLFLFDCWYGPAVLSERPEVRVKRLADDEIEVLRICEPVLKHNENCVDVNYQVLVTEKKSGEKEQLQESHKMRYLFMPEVVNLSKEYGMKILFAQEWMTGRDPGDDTWGVCFGLANDS